MDRFLGPFYSCITDIQEAYAASKTDFEAEEKFSEKFSKEQHDWYPSYKLQPTHFGWRQTCMGEENVETTDIIMNTCM